MAVLVRNVMPNMTREQYEEASPKVLALVQKERGFQLHVGFPAPNGGWAVSEIWDTAEDSTRNFETNVLPNVPEGAFNDATHEVIENVNVIAARSQITQ